MKWREVCIPKPPMMRMEGFEEVPLAVSGVVLAIRKRW
jgi:hypothetical protein